MTVSSPVGQGTTFSIYLPSAKSEETSTRQATSDKIPQGNGELILLVDDEPMILETARVALEASGYRVTTAGGGAEAVAYYQHHVASVDAVLLDTTMPGMDGVATQDRLRAIDPQVPIIVSSGVRRPSEEERRLADVDGFLPKPYSDTQLLRVVRRVLDARVTKHQQER